MSPKSLLLPRKQKSLQVNITFGFFRSSLIGLASHWHDRNTGFHVDQRRNGAYTAPHWVVR